MFIIKLFSYIKFRSNINVQNKEPVVNCYACVHTPGHYTAIKVVIFRLFRNGQTFMDTSHMIKWKSRL